MHFPCLHSLSLTGQLMTLILDHEYRSPFYIRGSDPFLLDTHNQVCSCQLDSSTWMIWNSPLPKSLAVLMPATSYLEATCIGVLLTINPQVYPSILLNRMYPLLIHVWIDSCVKALIFNVMILGGGAFGRWFSLNVAMRVKAPWWD